VKEEKAAKEKFDLIEKERNTLTERLEGMNSSLRELAGLRLEIKVSSCSSTEFTRSSRPSFPSSSRR